MPDKDTLNLIINGVIAVGAAFAALAAWLSAATARDATKHAQTVEHRSLFRELISKANEVVADSVRAADLAERLKSAHLTLSNFQGTTDTETDLIASAENLRVRMEEVHEAVSKQLENRIGLRTCPDETLTDMLTTYDGHIVAIRHIKEKLTRDLATVEQVNQTYREDAIRNRPYNPPPLHVADPPKNGAD